jgi:hypothetical protein
MITPHITGCTEWPCSQVVEGYKLLYWIVCVCAVDARRRSKCLSLHVSAPLPFMHAAPSRHIHTLIHTYTHVQTYIHAHKNTCTYTCGSFAACTKACMCVLTLCGCAGHARSA